MTSRATPSATATATARDAAPGLAPAALDAEAARQQALVAALWPRHAGHPGTADALDALLPHLRPDTPVTAARGLQAYRLNAGAAAERALSATFPVIRALVGATDFAALARAFWLACPPARGDLAWAGESLASFIEQDAALRELPYLADVARLEWLVARAEGARDDDLPPAEGRASLHRLADTDPSALSLWLAPGAALMASRWPVATLWNAHDVHGPRAEDAAVPADEDALAEARSRLQAGQGEVVLAWREDGRVRVREVAPGEAAFLGAVLAGADLATALDVAAPAGGFAFDAWLVQALSTGLLRGITTTADFLSRPGAPPG